MPIYKLTYFNVKGLGESIRWMLAYAGIDYEDKRVTEDEWIILKPTMPFNQIPILEVDGNKRINQSTAICRYLAKQCDLDGKDDWENLEIDSVVDSITDLRIRVNAAFFERVTEAKIEKQKIAEETAELFVNRLDEQVKNNAGYLVGGKLTWSDIVLFSTLEVMNSRMARDLIDKAEHLKALRDKVQSLPSIKAWMEKRPKTG